MVRAPLNACFFYGLYLHSPCSGKVDSRMLGSDERGYETVDLCDSHYEKQRGPHPLSFNPATKRPRIDTLRGIPKPSSIPPPSAPQPETEPPPQYIVLSEERMTRKLAQRNIDSLVIMLRRLAPADRLAVLDRFCLFCGYESSDCKCK